MIALDESTHVSEPDLADLLCGRLEEESFDRLIRHLDDCPQCQQCVTDVSTADSFAEWLADGERSADDAVLAEPDCQAMLYHAAGSGEVRIDGVLPPVESLGPYRLLRPLGRGGMGAVYLAEHRHLKRMCAVKLLPRQFGCDAAWIGRFEREMQAVANLNHSGIVTAMDAGQQNGWHYLVMEYLEGLDLASIVSRIGPLDGSTAAAIMRDVCYALSAVHEAGLVHRDIKPSNIMITRDGVVKLLDLGLVLDQHDSLADMRLTTVGHVIGTLAFAAPEQLSEADTVDQRSDLYSVGATLFQLIAGQPAHCSSRGIAPLVIEKTSRPARRISNLVPDVSASLDQLVAEVMERDPAERPRSAAEVADRLADEAGGHSLKSVVSRATRIADPDASQTVSLPRIAVDGDALPPRRRSVWKWVAAALPLGAAAVAAIVITIQLGEHQLEITTDDSDIKVDVQEVRRDADRPSAAPTVDIAQMPASDVSPDAEKLFKGKPLSYWTNLLMIERDVETLAEAMEAVVAMADPGDAELVHKLFRPARRLGGWAASDNKDQPSHYFMLKFQRSYHRTMPNPGIAAIAMELPAGNEHSRAAALFELVSFGQLTGWAEAAENRALAERLHGVLVTLLQRDELHQETSVDEARRLALTLAVVLDKPVEEVPGAREAIEAKVAKAEKQIPDEMPWQGPWRNEPFTTAYLTPAGVLAAEKMGINLPPALAVGSWLQRNPEFQRLRYSRFLKTFKQDPKRFSDYLILWLFSSSSHWGGFRDNASVRPEFWEQALPIVTEHTSRPDVAVTMLEAIITGIGGMGGGMGGGMIPQIPDDLRAAAERALEVARRRAEEMPAAENDGSPLNSGGMF